jgi:hypothetical protein
MSTQTCDESTGHASISATGADRARKSSVATRKMRTIPCSAVSDGYRTDIVEKRAEARVSTLHIAHQDLAQMESDSFSRNSTEWN